MQGASLNESLDSRSSGAGGQQEQPALLTKQEQKAFLSRYPFPGAPYFSNNLLLNQMYEERVGWGNL